MPIGYVIADWCGHALDVEILRLLLASWTSACILSALRKRMRADVLAIKAQMFVAFFSLSRLLFGYSDSFWSQLVG